MSGSSFILIFLFITCLTVYFLIKRNTQKKDEKQVEVNDSPEEVEDETKVEKPIYYRPSPNSFEFWQNCARYTRALSWVAVIVLVLYLAWSNWDGLKILAGDIKFMEPSQKIPTHLGDGAWQICAGKSKGKIVCLDEYRAYFSPTGQIITMYRSTGVGKGAELIKFMVRSTGELYYFKRGAEDLGFSPLQPWFIRNCNETGLWSWMITESDVEGVDRRNQRPAIKILCSRDRKSQHGDPIEIVFRAV